jgi:hypothetical protein
MPMGGNVIRSKIVNSRGLGELAMIGDHRRRSSGLNGARLAARTVSYSSHQKRLRISQTSLGRCARFRGSNRIRSPAAGERIDDGPRRFRAAKGGG